MFNAIFRKLFWKEFRMLWPLWAAVVVLGLLVDLGIHTLFTGPKENAVSMYYGCACLLPLLYAVGNAGTQFAWELERGTFDRLRALPVTSGKVVRAKLAWTLASTAMLFLTLWGISLLWINLLDYPGNVERNFWMLFLLGALEVIAWGTIFSMRDRSPLMATIKGGVLATLVFFTVTSIYGYATEQKMSGNSLLMVYQDVWPYRLGILLALGVILFYMSPRWFDYWRRRESREKTELQWNSTARRKDYLHGDGGFLALCQQCWRQNRRLYLPLVISFPIVLILGIVYITCLEPHLNIKLYKDTANILVTLFAIYMFVCITTIPSNVFGADQSDHSFRFFAHHGIAPWKVWLSRLLLSGLFSLVVAGFLVAPLIARTRGGAPREIFEMLKAAPLLVGCGLMYGAFFSILCRSRVLAWLWTLIGLYALLIVTVLLLFQYPTGNALSLFFPLIGFAVASYWGVSDRIHNRSRKRVWTKRILLFVACFIAFIATVIYQRITLFPNVQLSPQAVADYQQIWNSPESGRLANELIKIDPSLRKTVQVDRPLEWLNAKDLTEGKSTNKNTNQNLSEESRPPKGHAWILDDAELEKILRIARDKHDPDWSKVDTTMLDGSNNLLWFLIAPTQTQNRLIDTAEYYSRTGEPKKSLDCLLAVIRLSPPTQRAHASTVVFDLLPRWATGPGITPKLLRKTIRRIANLTPPAIDLRRALLSDYFFNQKMLDTPDLIKQIDPTHNTLFAWMPWERARIKRLAKYSTQSELECLDRWNDFLTPPDPDISLQDMKREVEEPYQDKWLTHWGGIFLEVDRYYRPILSNHPRKFGQLLQAELFRRLAVTSLAIRTYQLEHDGELPKTINNITGILRQSISGIQYGVYTSMPGGPHFGFRLEGFGERVCLRPEIQPIKSAIPYQQPLDTYNLGGTPCIVLDRDYLFTVHKLLGYPGDQSAEAAISNPVMHYQSIPAVYPLPFATPKATEKPTKP